MIVNYRKENLELYLSMAELIINPSSKLNFLINYKSVSNSHFQLKNVSNKVIIFKIKAICHTEIVRIMPNIGKIYPGDFVV